MIYFSYNDFIDCTENGEIDKIIKVEEKVAKYEIKKGKRIVQNNYKNQIVKILREKTQLRIFLDEFFNISKLCDSENIVYCNNIKSISDKFNKDNIICKIKDKEIFIFIKVIENIDVNISYKMFENSLNIIKRWNEEEKRENKRYPIVIPIVIYTGKKIWKNSTCKTYNNIKYIKFEDNKINFSYNMININDLEINKLQNMKSEVAKEIVKLKNKYLQIN